MNEINNSDEAEDDFAAEDEGELTFTEDTDAAEYEE